MRKPALWQVCVLVGLGHLASYPSFAQDAMDCSTVANDRARLKCYDDQAALRKQAARAAAAATSAAAPGAAPSTSAAPTAATGSTSPPATSPTAAASSSSSAASAPAAASTSAPAAVGGAHAATPAPAAPAPAGAPSDFGLETQIVRQKKTAAPEQIEARVKAVATRPRGAYVVTLEDGQVWEETSHSSSSNPPRVGDTVTIKRGMLGSFFLAHDAGLALRVKRIN